MNKLKDINKVFIVFGNIVEKRLAVFAKLHQNIKAWNVGLTLEIITSVQHTTTILWSVYIANNTVASHDNIG